MFMFFSKYCCTFVAKGMRMGMVSQPGFFLLIYFARLHPVRGGCQFSIHGNCPTKLCVPCDKFHHGRNWTKSNLHLQQNQKEYFEHLCQSHVCPGLPHRIFCLSITKNCLTAQLVRYIFPIHWFLPATYQRTSC